jgi:hypothetical protein
MKLKLIDMKSNVLSPAHQSLNKNVLVDPFGDLFNRLRDREMSDFTFGCRHFFHLIMNQIGWDG